MANSNAYITPSGYRHLQTQLRRLWQIERPALTKRLTAAAALGDRSENGDYLYCKRQLAMIDRKIRHLDARMDTVQVVYDKPKVRDKVFFGARVTLQPEDGDSVSYCIVGPDETELHGDGISVDAPLARALLGKSTGERVEFTHGSATHVFRINAIEYQELSATP